MSWTKQSKTEDLGYGVQPYGDFPFGDIWGVIVKTIKSWIKPAHQDQNWTKI